jgi:glucosyl-3-phosphoglycerate synthase
MSDIFQNGDITTLHRLGGGGVARIERELCTFQKSTPIALVLPCHVRDLRTLSAIAAELRNVRYLRQIIVGLDGAPRRADFLRARRSVATMPVPPLIVWNDGPRMRRLHRALAGAGFAAGPAGKGRNVWICTGAVLAFAEAAAIAVHDCDVVTYERELLARLCHPVVHPALGFDFCKGWYARFNRRLHGRVMRLLVTPLLRALRGTLGEHPLLTFLDTFRYPLAGEFAMSTTLARRVRMHGDWAFDIGLLAEVSRHCAPRAICQGELCENYDHKHQRLSPRDSARGLHRMAADIVRAILGRLADEGLQLDAACHRALHRDYARHATDLVRRYAADAAFNGLAFSRAEELAAIAVFAGCIRAAQPAAAAPLIPDWDSVQAARPNFLPELRTAILADAAGAGD